MKTPSRLIRIAALVSSCVLMVGLGGTPAHAATKAKTKLVCKTVKGKKVCTRVAIKTATKATTSKNANASDTTIAHSTDTKAK